jgi:hypothetical protein
MQVKLVDEMYLATQHPVVNRAGSRSRSRSLGGIMLLTVFSTNAAFASGYMTAPEFRQKMPSFKACLKQLEATAAANRKQLKPRTFDPDGGFQQVSIQAISDGVETTGRNSARYDAKLWFHNGRLNKDGTQYEINHSWTQSGFECRGKTMIINGSQGYTLSTFEPVASKAP